MDTERNNQGLLSKEFSSRLMADNCKIDADELYHEKDQLESHFRERMEELEEERKRVEREYTERVHELKGKEKYKDDLIQSNLDKLNREKEEKLGHFMEMKKQLGQERAEKEKDINEEIERLRRKEVAKDQEVTEKVSKLAGEKNMKIEKLVDKINALKEEIAAREREFTQKAVRLNNDTSYKSDIMDDITDKEDARFRMEQGFKAKLENIEREKAEYEKSCDERMLQLQSGLKTTGNQLDTKIQEIYALKKTDMDLMNDKMSQLLQEKMKNDELFQVRIEQLKQEEQYKMRQGKIMDDIEQSKNLYNERLQQMEHEKQTKEDNFEKSGHDGNIGRLVRLKEMKGFTVADKDPDVRGWKVIGNDGDVLGKIDDLIVDKQVMKVRYLDVKVNKDVLDAESEKRHFLLPIGTAIVDEDDDYVIVPELDKYMVGKIPEMSGDTVTRDYEQTLFIALVPGFDPMRNQGNEFYNSDFFDDDRLFSSRRKESTKG